MSGAKEFLSKVLPWEQAGPDVWFNVHWKGLLPNPSQNRTHFWDGRACATLDELDKTIRFWGQGDNRDIYICMSSQSRYENKVSKANKPYKKAVRFQANVVGIKSFYIDVDVKPEAYPSTHAALAAFQKFVGDVGLPNPSCVVGSGSGGFHAHWVLDEVLAVGDWQPVADALAAAAQAKGLICDTQCTVDSVRILRVPGTRNWKTNPPGSVTLMASDRNYALADIKSVLQPFIGVKITHAGKPHAALFEDGTKARPALAGESNLSAGIEDYKAPPASIEAVAAQCPFVKNALVDHGAKHANPAWFMALNIASFTDEGLGAAIELSEGHASYSADETLENYLRIVSDHKARDIGWPSCSKIQSAGAVECATCPLRHYNKSPFNFTIEPEVLAAAAVSLPAGVSVATPIVDTWPEKYTKRADGLIYVQTIDPNGKPVEQRICPYRLSEGWVQKKPWTLHFTAVTEVGKSSHIEMPMEEIGGMGGPRKVLATQGLALSDREGKLTQEFLVAWIQKLQTQKDSVITTVPFGWSENDNGEVEGFAYAGRVWGDGWDRQTSTADASMSTIFSVKGDFKVWQAACKLITDQRRPELDVLLAASFAAPLTKFSGQSGILVSAFSGGGDGKSSTFQVGLSVWGYPKKAKSQLDDTGNQTFKKLGYLKSLPLYWDEMQSQKQIDKFAEHVFQLMGGRERGRMTGKLKLAETETWSSLMISAANTSLLDILQTKAVTHTAGLMRIFEYELPKFDPKGPGRTNPSNASRMLELLETNHGHAGLKYSQFLGANYVQIREDVKTLNNHIDRVMNIGEKERYWSAAMTVLIKGAEYANKLGLTDIPIRPLQDFLGVVLERMRLAVKESNVDMGQAINISTLMQQFMAEMKARHTLLTDRCLTGAGKPLAGSVKVLNDVSKMDGMYVQIGQNDHIVRISNQALTDWLRAYKPNPIPQFAFFRALREVFNYKKNQSFLGGGTAYRSDYKSYIIEIDGNDFPDLWQE